MNIGCHLGCHLDYHLIKCECTFIRVQWHLIPSALAEQASTHISTMIKNLKKIHLNCFIKIL